MPPRTDNARRIETIQPSRDDWRVAHEVHAKFAAKHGSDHIATEFALAHLAALVRTNKIESVLEFGSGIGTITYLLLKLLPPETKIVCAERNAWCREQFQLNIPAAQRERVNLLPEARPKIEGTFDLVVIDGPVTDGAAFLHIGSLCFLEGSRQETWAQVDESIKQLGLRCAMTPSYNWRTKIKWTPTRFRIPRPQFRKFRKKGCWVGYVEAAGPDKAQTKSP